MPSLDKGLTITWAKKNYDIRDILKLKKETGIKLTDYVCEAIRFFEKNKENVNSSVDMEVIENLIDKKVKDYIKNLSEISVTSNEESRVSKFSNLEDVDDIDDCEIDDD